MLKSCYYELSININPNLADIMSDFCFENLPCEGVILAEETYKDLELISTTEGTLKVFLTENVIDIENILKKQRNVLKERGLSEQEIGSFNFIIEKKENKDWSEKWKEQWDVTHVSDKIVVVPDWIDYVPKQDEIIIKLEPGCAFGTGTHPTTQLCMRAIEKHTQKGVSVADIGTGSGILAICAKKFGADYVYGCDNDETVIDVAKQNAFKNNVQCVFELNTADKINNKFDLVLANILHNVLADIMNNLKNLLKPEGILVLSGILDEKKQIVLDAIEKCGLTLIEETHQNQWTALSVRRKV